MGTFKWPMRIASMDGQQAQDIEATVDTGASFTTLPSRLPRELGVEPMGKRGFLLADSRRIEMDYGEARVTIDGDTAVACVVHNGSSQPYDLLRCGETRFHTGLTTRHQGRRTSRLLPARLHRRKVHRLRGQRRFRMAWKWRRIRFEPRNRHLYCLTRRLHSHHRHKHQPAISLRSS